MQQFRVNVKDLNWPLMNDCIAAEDTQAMVDFLSSRPRLTQGEQVKSFEQQWSDWLGVKHSVFVTSGSAANLLSMAVIKHKFGQGEVIVPALTWVSDVASILHTGLTPVFVDIDLDHLGMSLEHIKSKITDKTRAIFLTHVLGLNGLSDELIELCKEKDIPLIEDVCESHGATHKGQKLGAIGLMSNFSFYFAHHMTTIEGGMISTNDSEIYQMLRMFRGHGLVRESTDEKYKQKVKAEYPDLNPEFIFSFPAFNVRSSELNAVLGQSQLKRLDSNNEARSKNYKTFLDNLDSEKFVTNFKFEGSCNYAFTLLMKQKSETQRDKLMQALTDSGVEYRKGMSGGGNQLRQPYLKNLGYRFDESEFKNTEHVHHFGFYIGNYPGLEEAKILELCKLVNQTLS